MTIKHGLVAYRNHVCRCDICREAHKRYELLRQKKQRQRVKRTMNEYRLMESSHDTYTRKELEAIRNKSNK